MAATSATKTLDFNRSSELTMLDCILDALKATNRTIRSEPHPFPPPHFTADNLADFRTKKVPGGWVADIYFRVVPRGEPDAIGTPDAHPFETEQDAFIAGASRLCVLLTGSSELPFSIVGDKLVVVAY
ncbi:MAG: hypothetical protein ABJN39_12285 [Sulfitobacter sp.]|uniref:hypothetical protein n=1 Tax=Alphaproteobacteria TaxID=28211 RepID=UPI0032998CC7